MTLTAWLKSICCAVIMLAIHGQASANEAYPFIPEYPFDTAIIHYEGSGAFNGISTLYIDQQRQALRKQQEMTIMGMKQKTDSLTITTPETITHVDFTSKTATTTANPVAIMKEEWEAMSDAEQENVRHNIEKFGVNMALSMGGTFEKESDEILGYSCDKVTVMGSSTCSWTGYGIPLSSAVTLGIQGKEVAVKIEEDTELPEKMFTVPEGITVKPAPQGDIASNMARSMIRSMASDEFEERMLAGASLTPEAGLAPAAGGITPDTPKGMPSSKELQKMMHDAEALMKQLNTGQPQ